MDIAEKRLPQDGSFMVKMKGKFIDLRVSTLPTIYGEKIVLRILDKSRIPLELAKLGFLPQPSDPPRLVKLTRWELKVKGDDTPYGDYVANASDAVRIAQDGSITVMIRPPQATANLLRTFRPDQIDSFKVEGQWYVDDFGGINQIVAERSEQPQSQPAPRPATVQPNLPQPIAKPPARQPTSPPAGTGGGSPDGPGTPQGWGSPDG